MDVTLALERPTVHQEVETWRGAEVAVTDIGGERDFAPSVFLDVADGLRATPGTKSTGSLVPP